MNLPIQLPQTTLSLRVRTRGYAAREIAVTNDHLTVHKRLDELLNAFQQRFNYADLTAALTAVAVGEVSLHFEGRSHEFVTTHCHLYARHKVFLPIANGGPSEIDARGMFFSIAPSPEVDAIARSDRQLDVGISGDVRLVDSLATAWSVLADASVLAVSPEDTDARRALISWGSGPSHAPSTTIEVTGSQRMPVMRVYSLPGHGAGAERQVTETYFVLEIASLLSSVHAGASLQAKLALLNVDAISRALSISAEEGHDWRDACVRALESGVGLGPHAWMAYLADVGGLLFPAYLLAASNEVPSKLSEAKAIRIKSQPRCPYCHTSVLPGYGRGCAQCQAWQHEDCWLEFGTCAACRAEPAGSRGPVSHEPPEIDYQRGSVPPRPDGLAEGDGGAPPPGRYRQKDYEIRRSVFSDDD